MLESTFHIAAMDCPAEEQLVRMALEPLPGIQQLTFDLQSRKLTVHHESAVDDIDAALRSLCLGSRLENSRETTGILSAQGPDQRKILWTVLAINFLFFLVEAITGWLSGSMGLLADSLDMLADALVYGLSLVAVGASLVYKKRVARMAGYTQAILAVLGFVEVIRRTFFHAGSPEADMMIGISLLALVANGVSYYLLARARSSEAHIRASMIFTANDVLINLGVILAGLLVGWLHSPVPDLVIGSVIFLIVARGAGKILALGR